MKELNLFLSKRNIINSFNAGCVSIVAKSASHKLEGFILSNANFVSSTDEAALPSKREVHALLVGKPFHAKKSLKTIGEIADQNWGRYQQTKASEARDARAGVTPPKKASPVKKGKPKVSEARPVKEKGRKKDAAPPLVVEAPASEEDEEEEDLEQVPVVADDPPPVVVRTVSKGACSPPKLPAPEANEGMRLLLSNSHTDSEKTVASRSQASVIECSQPSKRSREESESPQQKKVPKMSAKELSKYQQREKKEKEEDEDYEEEPKKSKKKRPSFNKAIVGASNALKELNINLLGLIFL